jgi:hypothetical protein
MLDGDAWRVASRGEAPPARIGHSAATAGSAVLLYGGTPTNGSNVFLADLWRFDAGSGQFAAVAVTGDPLGPLAFHTAVAHPHRDAMVVFGGCNSDGRSARVAIVAADGGCEVVPPPAAAPFSTWPVARYCHSAVVFGGAMYVFGGKCGGRRSNSRLDDLRRFDLATRTWSQCAQHGDRPRPRSAHSAVVCGRSMFVAGGRLSDAAAPAGDPYLYEYAFDTGVWRRRCVADRVLSRARHSALHHNGAMIVVGGCTAADRRSAVVVELDTMDVRAAAATDAAPQLRVECAATAICDNTMFVFDGREVVVALALPLGPPSLLALCRAWLVGSACAVPRDLLPYNLERRFEGWRALTEVRCAPSGSLAAPDSGGATPDSTDDDVQ